MAIAALREKLSHPIHRPRREGEYLIVFYGLDGDFEYRYGTAETVEAAFRVGRLRGLSWTFDGDTWSSETTMFQEAGKHGSWAISRFFI